MKIAGVQASIKILKKSLENVETKIDKFDEQCKESDKLDECWSLINTSIEDLESMKDI